MKLSFCFLSLAVIASLTGCASLSGPTYEIEVDAYRRAPSPGAPSLGNRVFVTSTGSEDNVLLAQEVTRKLGRAIREMGNTPVTDLEDSDAVLVFSYGIGDPRTEPISTLAYIPGRNIRATTTIGTETLTTTARTSGRLEVVPGSSTVYDRFLVLSLFGTKELSRTEGDEGALLWRAYVTSSGSSSDLRLVMNYLIASGMDQFHRSTGRRVTYQLQETNPAIRSMLNW